AVTAPANPTKTGYTFNGWEPTLPETMPAEDMTITAKWTINQYTITFADTGDATIAPITQDFGTAVTKPANPTKTGYTFAGWDVEVPSTMPAEDTTITALWTINQYSITFNTDGGSAVETITQNYNSAVTAPAAPTKVGYTFAGWDKEIPATMPAEDMTITAQWTVNSYTITWYDEDGKTVLYTDDVAYGKTPVYNSEAPTKQATAEFTYEFDGWTPAVSTVTGEASYVAKYKATKNSYLVTWLNEDETVLSSGLVEYGVVPTYTGTPTKEANAQYTYTFDGWDIEPSAVTGEATYTAKYAATVNEYTIVWMVDGSRTTTKVAYGKRPYYGDEPSKSATTQYTYTFEGWKDSDNTYAHNELPVVTGTATYTASFVPTVNKYTVTWNIDGTEYTEVYEYGSTPAFKHEISKPQDEINTYEFDKWSPAISSVMGDAYYTAVFKADPRIYSITFNTNGGSTINPITGIVGEKLPECEDPVKEGYTFAGWDTELPETMPAGGLTLNAQWTINQYILKFDTVGGSEIDPITQDYDTAVSAPENPTKEGHTFLYWADEDGNKVSVPETMPSADTTLTAVWQLNQYTVSWDIDGDGTVDDTTVVNHFDMPSHEDGSKATDDKFDYTFIGWNPELTTVTGPVTYTAQFSPSLRVFEITWGVEGVVTKTYVEYGTVPTFPGETPAKESDTMYSYEFSGWYDVSGNEPVAATKTANYIARFESVPVEYTISFDVDGGDPIESITAGYGTQITAPVATKTGYTFAGWVDTNGNPATVPATMPVGGRMLKATWTVNQYAITFNTDGGNAILPITANFGDAIVAPADPVKEGYTFTGWTPAVPATMPAENMTVTANWAINKYTITLDTDGGNEVQPITQNYGTNLIIPVVYKEGYTFMGWLDANGNPTVIPSVMPAENRVYKAWWAPNTYSILYYVDYELYYEDYVACGYPIYLPEEPVKEGFVFGGWMPVGYESDVMPEVMPAVDLMVDAVWNELFTIAFTDGDNNVISKQQLQAGSSITVPMQPEKLGYTFAGWDKTVPSTMPEGNLTINATWTANLYTITFVDTGDTAIAPITQPYGSAITAPAAPTKVGYTFNGWSPEIPATMPVDGMTVTATWTVNEYQITFNTNGGNAIEPIKANYGDAIIAPQTPTKTGYTFAGWDAEFPATMPAGGMTLNAKWDANEYTIYWDTDGDGESDDTTNVAYDTVPTHEDGEKAADAEYTYVFTGWNPEIHPVTGSVTYTATFEAVPNVYTVSFDTDGGSEIADIEVAFGSEIKAPAADPVKEGYTFTGWSAIPETMPAKNVTVVAQWKANEYTISFNTGDGSGVSSITVSYGNAISKPNDPTKEGYTFAGWTVNGTDAIEFPETMPVGGLELTALWTVNQYTITYVVDDNPEYSKSTLDYNAKITQPSAPEKVGYKFIGWTPEVPETMPAKDLTVTAQWEAIMYTISFNTDGGSEVADVNLAYGSTVEISAKPTKTGYTFKGWENVPETMPAENVTVNAIWEVNQYTISFANTGDSKINAITADFGTKVTSPADPVKTGYTFKGWDNMPETMPAENVTVSAIWEVNQYTISFANTGDSKIDAITADFGSEVEAPADPVKTGYTFAGWDRVIPAEMPAENVTITAKWTINQYTIKFDTDGGSAVADITADFGTAVTKPADPTKVGYTFAGWDVEVPSTMPAENVIIKAKWTINQYTIKFDTDGGSAVTDITADFGTAVTKPADPTKVGYTFAGWDVEVPSTMPAENVTITAKWTINQYTIKFDTDGGSAVADITDDFGSNVKAPADPVKTGYTFKGWDNLPETMPAENVTVNAIWEVNQYTITYVVDDNSEYAKYTLNFGDTVTIPAVPTKADYTFDGWTPDVPTTMPAKDITVTAKWKYTYTGWLEEDGNTTYLVNGTKAYFGEWVAIEGNEYYFDETSYVVKGISEVSSKDSSYTGKYIFDETTGALDKSINGLYDVGDDTYYAAQGEILRDLGVVIISGEYYYFGEDDKAVKDGTYAVEKTNGLIEEGNYRFDKDGKIIFVLRGDLDDDGDVDNIDAIYMLYSVVFGEGDYPLNQSGDFNGDKLVDNNDAIYLLYHVIFGAVDYPLSD
ncbi:MAG: InlB B-repeat-containing protein, partial [Oscillospiraceae bacterium]|nr:InlB B-repeat-containing protein [Oscillospiraceae bacterium]